MAGNNLGEIVRLTAVAELMKHCRNADGSYDPAKVKAYAKSAYRKTAIATHPDQNPNNPELHPLFRESTEVWELIDAASDTSLIEIVTDYRTNQQGPDPEAQALLEGAAQMIQDLQGERDDLQSRLTTAHTNLINVTRRTQAYKPDMIDIYNDPKRRIKITLANAATEIPRLIAGKADPALEQRLQEAERQVGEYTSAIARKDEMIRVAKKVIEEDKEILKEVEKQRDAERIKVGTLSADKIIAERRYETERERANDLDQKHKVALRTIAQEVTARTAQEKKAASLEETLRATTDAASALMVAELARQRTAYETRIACLEAALPSADPIETLLAQKAAIGDAHTQYQLAQYLITKESVKDKKDPRKIKQAEENIKKALKGNYSLLESTIALARNYQSSGQDQLAVGIMRGVYAAVDDTRDREVRLTGGLEGYHAYSPQFSTLITTLISQKENSTLRRETRGKLTQMVQENADFEEPLYQAATALRLQKEFDLAEEMAITLANASNKPKYWSFIGNVINDSPTGKRADRVQWAQECYRRAGK